MINIIYAALPMCAQTQTEHAKTTSAKLYIYIGVGARDLYIDEAHTALDIFRFVAFFDLIIPSMRISKMANMCLERSTPDPQWTA